MSAFDVMMLIDQIAATSSRSEKERLTCELAKFEVGRFALKWAYDPNITYGINVKVMPEGNGMDIAFTTPTIEPLLTKLATRRLAGKAAEREVHEVLAALNDYSRTLLLRILMKDLKCGIAESTINLAMPGLIPVFSVMRAQKFEEKRLKSWPQIIEPKLDGYRFTFLCRDGHGGFFTRSGKRAPAADHLVEPMIATALVALQVSQNNTLRSTLSTRPGDLTRYARDDLNFMVDGEMMMPGDFNETGALRRKDEQALDATFHVFDIMSYADFNAPGSFAKPYMERRKLVEEFVANAVSDKITKTPRYIINSVDEAYEYYNKFRERGLEGAMVKDPNGFYDKKKSYSWLKMKAEESEDLPIVGVFQGEPMTKYEHCLGGIIVRRENGVNVSVGGGFTDQQREELWELWKADAKELRILPDCGPKGVFVQPTEPLINGKLISRLAEIRYHEETPDGSLRHPRFLRFRDDKAGELEAKEVA